MKTQRGWVQGYNAQVAADTESQVIVAQNVTRDHSDVRQLAPMLESCEEQAGRRPDGLLADAGYWSEENAALEDEATELWISKTKDWKRTKELREQGPPRGRIPNDVTTRERMEGKLRTKGGRKVYKERGSTIEPVFGQMEMRDLSNFLLRGLGKVRTEWSLFCSTHNTTCLSCGGAAGGPQRARSWRLPPPDPSELATDVDVDGRRTAGRRLRHSEYENEQEYTVNFLRTTQTVWGTGSVLSLFCRGFSDRLRRVLAPMRRSSLKSPARRNPLYVAIAAFLFALLMPGEATAQWTAPSRFPQARPGAAVLVSGPLHRPQTVRESAMGSTLGEIPLMIGGGAAAAAAGVLAGYATAELVNTLSGAIVGIGLGVVVVAFGVPLGVHLANGVVDGQRGRFLLTLLASAAAGGAAAEALVAYNTGAGPTWVEYAIVVPSAQIPAAVIVELLTE